MYTPLQLKKNEERRLLAGHLWIYSNEIDASTPLTSIEPGSLVRVQSSRGNFLGIGYCNPHALLTARLLARNDRLIDTDFFIEKIQRALEFRDSVFSVPYYRLVFAESDRLPGLVIDRYGSICVVQITTLGMWKLKNEILSAVQTVIHPTSILLSTKSATSAQEQLEEIKEQHGAPIEDPILIQENNAEFYVSLLSGQKTGWFYDQRENHQRLAAFTKGKRVLDLFSYVGGFGIQAALAGATSVTSVDSSASAIDLLNKNSQHNRVSEIIRTEVSDAVDYLKKMRETGESFDVIVLDPPAYIKRRKDLKSGTLAYQRINELALSLLSDNGLLLSCSCSMQFTLPMLIDCVRRSALKTKSELQIVSQGFQAADHPIHPAIPETAYLKAIFIRKTRGLG